MKIPPYGQAPERIIYIYLTNIMRDAFSHFFYSQKKEKTLGRVTRL